MRTCLASLVALAVVVAAAYAGVITTCRISFSGESLQISPSLYYTVNGEEVYDPQVNGELTYNWQCQQVPDSRNPCFYSVYIEIDQLFGDSWEMVSQFCADQTPSCNTSMTGDQWYITGAQGALSDPGTYMISAAFYAINCANVDPGITMPLWSGSAESYVD